MVFYITYIEKEREEKVKERYTRERYTEREERYIKTEERERERHMKTEIYIHIYSRISVCKTLGDGLFIRSKRY